MEHLKHLDAKNMLWGEETYYGPEDLQLKSKERTRRQKNDKTKKYDSPSSFGQ